MIYISLFLITLLLSSVVVSTVSSIKNYFDAIELAEDTSSNNANNGVEEEEEEATFNVDEEFKIIKKKHSYIYSDVQLCYTFFEVQTRPPIKTNK